MTSAAILGLLGVLAGCGGGGGVNGGGVGNQQKPSPASTPTLQSIEVTPSALTAAAGTQAQFTATGVFTDNSTQDLTGQVIWASFNEAVATVSNDASSRGLATAEGIGGTTVTDTTGVVNRVLVRRDFDVATWAYGLLDESDNNYNQLVSTFASANPRYGYGNAEMDAAIDLLRTADTDAKRTEAYRQISVIWIRDAPAHVIAIVPQAIVHTPKMHDIVRTGSSITLYGKAWIEK
jgi:hypothetical protein